MVLRFIYGMGLFILVMGGLIAGSFWWAIVLGGCAFFAGNEFLNMTIAKGMKPSTRVVRSMIVAFFVVATLPSIPAVHKFLGMDIPPTWAVEHFPLVLTVGVVISFIRLLFRGENPPATIADIAATILGFIYLGWLPSHLVLLRNIVPPGEIMPLNPLQQPGLAYVWESVFIIVATDVFAYYVGKYFGKNLLYPQVSPKKTVEGAIGGLLSAVFWATVVVYLADHYVFPNHPFRDKLWQAPLMGAVVSICSQLGDLCESLLKRDAGVKDSGNLIPGHGGMLDRGDGLLFAGAISYYWICIVVLRIL